MSITDELREWAKMLIHWWYDPVKDEYTYTTGIMPPSIDAIRLDSNIIAIADRIDAEHKRAMADAYLSGTPTDEKLTELGWIRLPKDADGEYIHVGDWIINPDLSNQKHKVAAITPESVYWWGEDGCHWRYIHLVHHYHAPTVDDVLLDACKAYHSLMVESMGDVAHDMPAPSEVIAKYAKRLTLAEEEDA